jgi:rhomboid family GlyGly-CTERM serine protease
MAGWFTAAARRPGGVSLLLATIAVAVALAPPSLADVLQFDRAAVLSGQVHRLITCQWTHWGNQHLLWDAATFLALGFACERRCRRQFFAALVLAVKFLPAAIFLLLPKLEFYRGLSALDCALFAVLATDVLREGIRNRRRAQALVVGTFFAGFLIKTSIEALTGRSVFVDSAVAGFAPLPLAHLFGVAAGIAGYFLGGSGCIACCTTLLAPTSWKLFKSVQNVPGPAKISFRSVGAKF